MEPAHPWGKKKNESFQRETNNLQFKCIRDQAVPPTYADRMQMIYANGPEQALGLPMSPLPSSQLWGSARSGLCQKPHLGPRGLGVNI